jgi:hypothetical protein
LVGPSLLHIRRAGPKAKDAVADTRTDSRNGWCGG